MGVRGAHDAEVAAVERCDLGLVKSLDKRDDACIDNPETEVGVLALQCCAACQVILCGTVRRLADLEIRQALVRRPRGPAPLNSLRSGGAVGE